MLYIKNLKEDQMWSYTEFKQLMKKAGIRRLSLKVLRRLGYKVEYRTLAF